MNERRQELIKMMQDIIDGDDLTCYSDKAIYEIEQKINKIDDLQEAQNETNEDMFLSNKDSVLHISCSSCRKNITRFEDGEITSMTHFDLSRSSKSFVIDDDRVEEEIEERNEKMNRVLCEECFLEILNSCEKLGKMFLFKDKNCFIY